jgi:hypothetical protein
VAKKEVSEEDWYRIFYREYRESCLSSLEANYRNEFDLRLSSPPITWGSYIFDKRLVDELKMEIVYNSMLGKYEMKGPPRLVIISTSPPTPVYVPPVPLSVDMAKDILFTKYEHIVEELDEEFHKREKEIWDRYFRLPQ